ncbi:MAG: hypothetical protein KF718_30830 [Polyangiaceae bacterium]|nr:hypothetical protein [Polyangiaceae bacterium]
MRAALQGGFGPPGYGPPPYPPPGPPLQRTDQLAVIALVSSLLGLIGAVLNGVSGLFGACCVLCTVGTTVLGVLVLVPSLAGAVMGGMSIARINREPERLGGKMLAVAALVVGVLSSFAAIAEIVLPWFGLACMTAAQGLR